MTGGQFTGMYSLPDEPRASSSRYRRRSSAGRLARLPRLAEAARGQAPNQLSRAPSIVRTAPLKKSPAGEAR